MPKPKKSVLSPRPSASLPDMEPLRHCSVATPLGTFGFLLRSDAGTDHVIVSGFAELVNLLPMLPRHLKDMPVTTLQTHPYTQHIRGYFDGDLSALNRVPVQQAGGAFFAEVWQTLRRITPGSPVTYGELAAAAGRPQAARAAGTACARNAAALLVPCHRALRTDQKVRKYLYGSGIKQALLNHEARYAQASG